MEGPIICISMGEHGIQGRAEVQAVLAESQ